MAKSPTVFYQQNYVKLFTGGWDTPLTKNRINDVLAQYGASLYQQKNSWFVYINLTGEVVRFHEGLKVWSNGRTE